jgi:L-fuconolactonase
VGHRLDTDDRLTYEQGVAPFRDDTNHLSANDKAALMGGTLQKVYKW